MSGGDYTLAGDGDWITCCARGAPHVPDQGNFCNVKYDALRRGNTLLQSAHEQ